MAGDFAKRISPLIAAARFAERKLPPGRLPDVCDTPDFLKKWAASQESQAAARRAASPPSNASGWHELAVDIVHRSLIDMFWLGLQTSDRFSTPSICAEEWLFSRRIFASDLAQIAACPEPIKTVFSALAPAPVQFFSLLETSWFHVVEMLALMIEADSIGDDQHFRGDDPFIGDSGVAELRAELRFLRESLGIPSGCTPDLANGLLESGIRQERARLALWDGRAAECEAAPIPSASAQEPQASSTGSAAPANESRVGLDFAAKDVHVAILLALRDSNGVVMTQVRLADHLQRKGLPNSRNTVKAKMKDLRGWGLVDEWDGKIGTVISATGRDFLAARGLG